MNFKSWNDEELRRALVADPDDTAAICEAAERFKDQRVIDEDDVETVFEVLIVCPECDHEWEETVDTADLV